MMKDEVRDMIKSRRVLMILLLLLVVVSMVGCSKDNDERKNSEENDINEDISKEKDPKYLTDDMVLFEDVDVINGQIKGLFLSSQRVLTNDNTIYEYYYNFEKIAKLDLVVESILNNYSDSLYLSSVVRNTDGSISYINSSGEIEYTVQLDNVVYLTSIFVTTLEDGHLYSYRIEDGKLGDKYQVYLALDRYSSKDLYTGLVEIEYIPDNNYFFFKLENGQIRHYSNSNYYCNDDNKEIRFYIAAGEKEYLEGKELYKILHYDTTIGEIVATKEKNTSIYYFDESVFDTIGDYARCTADLGKAECYESIKKEIILPDGYTVDDIDQVMSESFNYDLMLVMNDKKVYHYKNEKEWVELTYISQLNKENHIVEMKREIFDTLLVLCDDGYLYEYDL